MASGKIQIVRSSLPYQILLYFNAWYFAFFWICEALMFIYKGETLPFPDAALAAEVILIFILAGLEAIRLFLGMKGNLTERVVAVVMSMVISLPSLFGCLYLLIWQTYVLRAEVILNAIQLAFIAFEFLFGIISCITFARAPAY